MTETKEQARERIESEIAHNAAKRDQLLREADRSAELHQKDGRNPDKFPEVWYRRAEARILDTLVTAYQALLKDLDKH
jgi:hypothetical protein